MTTNASRKSNIIGHNRFGFPIVTCSRCGGCGEFSYNQLTGTTCFKCQGSGKTIRGGKTAAAWADFVGDRRRARSVLGKDVVVGESVRFVNEEFRTVASIATTDEVCGYTESAGVRVETYYRIELTFTDGSTARVAANSIGTRETPKVIDPAPYLAAAGYVRKD